MLLTLSCGGGRRPAPVPLPSAPAGVARSDAVPATVRVVRDDGHVDIIELERYVRGAVEAETWVPRSEGEDVARRVFEVQALIARTYVAANLGRHRLQRGDVCDTTHCQLFREPVGTHVHDASLDAALDETAGRVLLFEGSPILALFHASCGGATSAPESIWGGRARAYLRHTDDVLCARVAVPWRVRLERPALVKALDADPRTTVDGRLDAIDVVSRDEGDRAVLVALTGARSPVVRGEELRAVLARAFGARLVRSTRFHVQRDGEAFVLEGTGFGHGAGLCQAGALALLRDGASVEDVVAHYYPGSTIGLGTRLETRWVPGAGPPALRSDRPGR